jgi:3-phenylpropionate/cinnamic acid dioxygenase small subunit
LFAEARLLDERRFDEWEALFTDDGTYWVPIDPTTESRQGISIISDDRKRLHERVYRLTQTPVLDQNPPSRTIRFVSNVEVEPDGVRETRVRCRQLITEMRPGGLGQAGMNLVRLFPAHCEYRLRRTGKGGWKIAQKKVVLLDSDQPHYNLSFIP